MITIKAWGWVLIGQVRFRGVLTSRRLVTSYIHGQQSTLGQNIYLIQGRGGGEKERRWRLRGVRTVNIDVNKLMCEHFIFDNEMLLEEKKQSTLTINVAGQV
jgi:hypothetical protein